MPTVSSFRGNVFKEGDGKGYRDRSVIFSNELRFSNFYPSRFPTIFKHHLLFLFSIIFYGVAADPKTMKLIINFLGQPLKVYNIKIVFFTCSQKFLKRQRKFNKIIKGGHNVNISKHIELMNCSNYFCFVCRNA